MKGAQFLLASGLALALPLAAHAQEPAAPSGSEASAAPPTAVGQAAPAAEPAPSAAPAPAEPVAAKPEPAVAQAVTPRRPRRDDMPPLGLFPDTKDDLIDPKMARSWGVLPARQFWATTFDVGFVYARPRVSLGYGRPFTNWVGVDVNPIASGSGIGAYGGLRAEIPHLDLRVGSRYFRSFNRTYLQDRESYTRIELETSTGVKAHTLTYEAELDASWPVGPGSVIGRGSISYVSGVPEGRSVFEETLHVIVKPPLVWRARVGYVFVFGRYRQHSIGIVLDALDVPKRDDSLSLRTGPILRLGLSRRVDLRGSFVTTITSPDRIGLVGGDFTELGVRYRWASE